MSKKKSTKLTYKTSAYNSAEDDYKDLIVIVNEALAKKVLAAVDKGLVVGVGRPEPGKMCVEAAVAFASGEDHSDDPVCVDDYLREYKVELNDFGSWSSPKARARGLRRVAIAQLGSEGHFDNEVFLKELTQQLVLHFKERYEPRPITSLKDLVTAPFDGEELSVDLDDRYAGSDGPTNKVKDWLRAVHPKWKGDQINSTIAELMVQALIKMKVPGTKWLYLTEKKKVKKATRKTKR